MYQALKSLPGHSFAHKPTVVFHIANHHRTLRMGITTKMVCKQSHITVGPCLYQTAKPLLVLGGTNKTIRTSNA